MCRRMNKGNKARHCMKYQSYSSRKLNRKVRLTGEKKRAFFLLQIIKHFMTHQVQHGHPGAISEHS